MRNLDKIENLLFIATYMAGVTMGIAIAKILG